MENDIHLNVHNEVMKICNVPKDFQSHWDFKLECSKNVKDGKCENILYMQKDCFSNARQQTASDRVKERKEKKEKPT